MKGGAFLKKFITIALSIFIVILLIAGIMNNPIKSKIADRLYVSQNEYVVAETATKKIRLQKGDYLHFGSYLDAPILWHVIDVSPTGEVLLFSQHILCYKAFDASQNSNIINFQWESSTLRQWLNTQEEQVQWQGISPIQDNVHLSMNAYANEASFLSDKNFTLKEKKSIKLYNGDNIFLLTQQEIEQFIPLDKRAKKPTKEAFLQDESRFFPSISTAWYWTRNNIATNQSSIATVTAQGTFYKSLAIDSLVGVCPALYLNSVTVTAGISGEGTIERPYMFWKG